MVVVNIHPANAAWPRFKTMSGFKKILDKLLNERHSGNQKQGRQRATELNIT